MCVLYGSVQLHPLCCISHTAVLHSNKYKSKSKVSRLHFKRRKVIVVKKFKRRIEACLSEGSKIVMGVMYSLLVGLFATLLVIVLVKMLTIIRVVKSLIMWCIRIKQLRSLPSPPRQWFWGHALYVRLFINWCFYDVK